MFEYICLMKLFLDIYVFYNIFEKVSVDIGCFCLLGLKMCGIEMFCCGGCFWIVIYMDMRLDE